MRLPTPTVREVRWSFIVVFACAVALTVTICWVIVHKVNQSEDIAAVAAANAAQVNRLSDQIDAQAAVSERQRRQLKTQNRQVHAELTALLRYLRAHGIEVPQTALTAPTPRESSRPKGPAQATPSPHPSGPASPAPTATPTPSTPGPGPDVLCTFVPLTCP